MKIQFRKHWSLAAAGFLCFAAGAFAQNAVKTPARHGVRAAINQNFAPAAVHSTANGRAPEAGKVSQKLFIITPESPGSIIFAADLLGLAGMAYLFRRRLSGRGLMAEAGGAAERGGQ